MWFVIIKNKSERRKKKKFGVRPTQNIFYVFIISYFLSGVNKYKNLPHTFQVDTGFEASNVAFRSVTCYFFFALFNALQAWVSMLLPQHLPRSPLVDTEERLQMRMTNITPFTYGKCIPKLVGLSQKEDARGFPHLRLWRLHCTDARWCCCWNAPSNNPNWSTERIVGLHS